MNIAAIIETMYVPNVVVHFCEREMQTQLACKNWKLSLGKALPKSEEIQHYSL